MSQQTHEAALSGDELARAEEEQRLYRETKVVDVRGTVEDHRCFKAEVHEPHDYEEEVWSEPRWVNPRTVWLWDCVGVRDETPYVTVLHATERGVWLLMQDAVAAPDTFPFCRRLIMSPFGDQVNLTVEVWKTPPREWPPAHAGHSNGGLNMDVEQARAVRDFLSSWLDEREETPDE
jgi:hypothetical protein